MRLSNALWVKLLAFVPTRGLQAALGTRPGVAAEFLPPGVQRTYSVRGVCWVTINED